MKNIRRFIREHSGKGFSANSEAFLNDKYRIEKGEVTLTTFRELGLSDSLLQSVESMGFKKATPIQAETIHMAGYYWASTNRYRENSSIRITTIR